MDPTVDTTATRVEKRSARTMPMPAGCLIAVGLMLGAVPLLAGVALIGLRLFYPGDAPPLFYLPGIASALVLALALVWSGTRTLLRARAGRQRAALHPGEPWYADWNWDPAEVREQKSRLGDLFVTLVLFGLCASFTMAFAPVLFKTDTGGNSQDDLAMLAVKLFGVVVIGFWDWMALRMIWILMGDVVRERRTGPSALRFETFPFFLGEAVRGRLTSPRLDGRDSVALTLRCLEERLVHRGGVHSEDSVQVFQIYEARQTMGVRQATAPEVDVFMALPAGDLETHLAPPPPKPRYWELTVETGEGDPLTFLVPVYARSPAR